MSKLSSDQIENEILKHLQNHTVIENSMEFAKKLSLTPQELEPHLKSLVADEYVDLKVLDEKEIELTAEAKEYLEKGTAEFQYANSLKVGEIVSKAEAESKMPFNAAIAKVGFSKAMKNKWIKLHGEKKDQVERIAETIVDEDQIQLQKFERNAKDINSFDKKVLDLFKKRKLIHIQTIKFYHVTKGQQYRPERQRLETELTYEMMRDGSWKNTQFKTYNFNSVGQESRGGHCHPLLKVREQFRELFLEMGFNEMPTNRYVESSFWNFDSLFQPQSHPARDMHDTFFLKKPVSANEPNLEYEQRVKDIHEKGGFDSLGYQYDWSVEESRKNILRTHTTAISSQMLYKLANQPGGFKPMKYFSIDRVFRNETLDHTHLAEFHQCEGLIADRGIGLGHLMGIIAEFYKKIGITQLKYKPAYNPYTEPSLEVFGYQPTLKKWIEIGNSGIFRPEMLRPMGIPEDVTVIAWGLSLERPTMIYYDIDNIRDLFGHKVTMKSTKDNTICYINPGSDIRLGEGGGSKSEDAQFIEDLQNLTPLQEMERKVETVEFMNIMLKKLKVDRGYRSVQFANSPLHYYKWNLDERKAFLGAHSKFALCKTMIMVNNLYREECSHDPYYAKYIMVIVQYAGKISSHKLMKIMKNYQNKHYTAKDQKDKKIGEKGFKFRMAEDGEAYRLSGYKFNAVTPFFMKDETLPIILSKEVANLDPAYFWLGGGRYTLKIGISVDDFKHYCGDRLIIEDIS